MRRPAPAHMCAGVQCQSEVGRAQFIGLLAAMTGCGVALAGCGSHAHQTKPGAAKAGFVIALPRLAHNPTGRVLGAIPVRGSIVPHAIGTPGATDPVVYHGGPVMHVMNAHAIFWAPPGFVFPAGYQALIEKYFGAVARASGTTGDVYAVARQYFDTTGPIPNRVSFAGSINVADPLPTSACSDPGVQGPCLSIGELSGEVQQIVSSRGLPQGLGDMYFLFTPSGIGSCFGQNGEGCYGYRGGYCAFHDWIGNDSASAIIWGNMPFGAQRGCDLFHQEPNGNPADAEVNVVSHEQIEAITDPMGTGWFGNDGGADEVGDKCYMTVPPMVGGAPGAQYDQLIGGVGFDVQPEWSNDGDQCALTLPHAPPWPTFTFSGVAAPGRTVSFDASRSAGQDGGVITGYSWDFGDGARAQGSGTSHAFQSGGQHTVTLTVSDSQGAQNSYTAVLAGGL